MKIFRMKMNAFLLAAAIGLLGGCNQDQAEQSLDTTADKARLSALLERTYRQGTGAEYRAIGSEYNRLNAQELELFNQLRMEKEMELLKQKQTYTAGEWEGLKHDLALTRDLRNDLNRLSLKQFGKPFTAVSAPEGDKLMGKVTGQPKYLVLFNGRPAGARMTKTTACYAYRFPSTATRKDVSGRSWSSWTYRATPDKPTDCDFEYTYPGSYTNFRPTDWWASELCQSFGNAILRRNESYYSTHLLFGATRLKIWIGDRDLLSVEMNY